MKKITNKDGFTLIELMITMGILGIISSVAVPMYKDYVIKSRVAEASRMMGSLKTQIGIYVNKYGSYPTYGSEVSYDYHNFNGKYVYIDISKPDNEVGVKMTVTFNSDAGDDLNGTSFHNTYDDATKKWSCVSDPGQVGNSTPLPVPPEYTDPDSDDYDSYLDPNSPDYDQDYANEFTSQYGVTNSINGFKEKYLPKNC